MPRVVWTEDAEDQLTFVRSDAIVDDLVALAAGLSRFPSRGRRVPESEGVGPYDIVREVILPGKARLFYLFIPDSDEVIILGLLTGGQQFRPGILRHYFD
jgi:plasmid stabilization system protein ParE